MRAEKALLWLGGLLIVLGVVSVAVLGAKARSGLYSGMGVGALVIVWSALMRRNVPWALPVAIGNVGFGALAFGWRAFVAWLALLDGRADRLVPGLITSVMCIACTAALPALLRRWREEEAAAG